MSEQRAGFGILGGTFDPPHLGHEMMAHAAYEGLLLERVAFVPSYSPPHKPSADLTSYEHRLEMTRLAVARVNGAELLPLDAQRSGPSYTVDLLRDLRDSRGDALYFILGADSLRDLPTWREPLAILSLCTLVVFARADVSTSLSLPGPASMIVFEQPVIDVSSTDLRTSIRQGRSDLLLSPEVGTYIQSLDLYQ